MNAAVPQLLSLDEVAVALSVSVRTVRRLIQRGELVAHRIGNQLRVDVAYIRRYLEASRIEVNKGVLWHVSTFSERHISRGGAEKEDSGALGSGDVKSRSERPIAAKPSNGSRSAPQNASQLRKAIRQLQRAN